jgi:hypothetical protein
MGAMLAFPNPGRNFSMVLRMLQRGKNRRKQGAGATRCDGQD